MDDLGEGNGTNDSDSKLSLSTIGLSSFDIALLEPTFTSGVLIVMYAFASSIGQHPVSFGRVGLGRGVATSHTALFESSCFPSVGLLRF